MRLLLLSCAGLLVVASAKLPIGFYTILRISTTIGAAAVIIEEFKKGITFWVVIFGIVAIVFNPVFPVYLGSKQVWQPIDIGTSILFLIKAFNNSKMKSDEAK